MISALFLKFEGKNSAKKFLILGMDSGKSPLFSMFNVDSYARTCTTEQSKARFALKLSFGP